MFTTLFLILIIIVALIVSAVKTKNKNVRIMLVTVSSALLLVVFILAVILFFFEERVVDYLYSERYYTAIPIEVVGDDIVLAQLDEISRRNFDDTVEVFPYQSSMWTRSLVREVERALMPGNLFDPAENIYRKDRLEGVLGMPDEVSYLAQKEPAKNTDPLIKLTYYVYKKERNLSNAKADSGLSIFLDGSGDDKGQIISVEGFNIDPIVMDPDEFETFYQIVPGMDRGTVVDSIGSPNDTIRLCVDYCPKYIEEKYLLKYEWETMLGQYVFADIYINSEYRVYYVNSNLLDAPMGKSLYENECEIGTEYLPGKCICPDGTTVTYSEYTDHTGIECVRVSM